MISYRKLAVRFSLAPFIATLLFACGGASKSDFIEACLIEAGDSSANQQAICECGADAAKSLLSSDAYQSMIYEMAGESGKAREISAAMSEPEQTAFIDGVSQVFDRCAYSEE